MDVLEFLFLPAWGALFDVIGPVLIDCIVLTCASNNPPILVCYQSEQNIRSISRPNTVKVKAANYYSDRLL